MTWTNNDGLTIRFGNEMAVAANVGMVQADGMTNKMAIEIEWGEQDAVGTAKTVETTESTAIPSGVHVVSATLNVVEAFTSAGAATLDLGLVKSDGTAYDADGIDAAIAKAVLIEGAVVACDGAVVNGVALTEKVYPSFTVGTAALTAGKALLEIEYLTL